MGFGAVEVETNIWNLTRPNQWATKDINWFIFTLMH